ncbi:Alpha/Beta hydrolase protein [Phaeosphaeriaceae sp. PMI808]|nr:Alpha/Beta hydrolase protein [Phaeosphaeriaceae sp. PMI808]
MVMLTAGQKASISPEATEILSNLPNIPFADFLSPFLASGRRVKTLRDSTSVKLEPIEEGIIATHNLSIRTVTISGVPVVIIEPPEVKDVYKDKILLNLYGGGFIMGNARERAALLMAAEMGIRVYSVSYSRSPEVRYPVARDEALVVYRELVKTHGPGNIMCMGSSSGGQILVSMLLVARNEGLSMPARVFLCTPALDLSGDGDSVVSNADRDIMPGSLLTAIVKQNYLPKGMDPRDPLYSPIYADYDSSFPPTVVTVGTRDLCLSNGVRIFWKLKDAGVRVELLISEGMWHGFNWMENMPEAIQARKAVRTFLATSPSDT